MTSKSMRSPLKCSPFTSMRWKSGVVSGEMRNPRRDLPRGLFIGVAGVIILYLLVTYVCLRVLGIAGLANTTTPASEVMRQALGGRGAKIIACGIAISTVGFLSQSILTAPRVYYAMAEDKVLPPIFKRLNEKTQVQEFAVTVFVSIMIITLFFTADFGEVLNYVMFFDSIALASAAASVFILRHRAKKDGEKPGVYKMKGYPWLPSIFIVVYTLVNISVMVARPQASYIGFLLFLSGLPLYWILRRLVNPK